jgi:adenylate cyclase
LGKIDQKAIDELIEWMVDGARPAANARDIIDAMCKRLRAAGVPINRFALFIYTLHPNSIGWRFVWTPEKGFERSEGPIGLFSTEQYTANPLPTVIAKQIAIRRRLADPDCPHDYIIIDELIADGFTDYLVQPIIYTTGETNAASWSSKAEGGFSDEAALVLERINSPLARITEAFLLRVNAASVLSAYVGRNGGDQVLKGKIHRGDGEEIEASILFTDIAGFTRLSNEMAGPEVVAMLNDAFDLMVPAVESHGGEILKFLGDGFFAIFPHKGENGLAKTADAARAAVEESEAAVAGAPVGERVSFRSAIHAGRFHYGNIGGANRLDFTAIGRPVNYTARLLAAASALKLTRVASELVAPHLGVPARLAEAVAFKGFSGEQPVFTY